MCAEQFLSENLITALNLCEVCQLSSAGGWSDTWEETQMSPEMEFC